MKKAKKKPRTSFSQICAAAESQILAHLEAKAEFSNRLAKSHVSARVRKVAYAKKSFALSRGLELEGFELRSDEQGRHDVARVRMQSGRTLHVAIGEMSQEARRNLRVLVTLGLAI